MLAWDHIHSWCPQRPDDGVSASGIEVTGRCELPYGYSLRKLTDYIHREIFLALETSTIIFSKILFYTMGTLPAYISAYHMQAWCLQRPVKRLLSHLKLELKTVVHHPLRCWEPNLGPLDKQMMLLSAEPSSP